MATVKGLKAWKDDAGALQNDDRIELRVYPREGKATRLISSLDAFLPTADVPVTLSATVTFTDPTLGVLYDFKFDQQRQAKACPDIFAFLGAAFGPFFALNATNDGDCNSLTGLDYAPNSAMLNAGVASQPDKSETFQGAIGAPIWDDWMKTSPYTFQWTLSQSQLSVSGGPAGGTAAKLLDVKKGSATTFPGTTSNGIHLQMGPRVYVNAGNSKVRSLALGRFYAEVFQNYDVPPPIFADVTISGCKGLRFNQPERALMLCYSGFRQYS